MASELRVNTLKDAAGNNSVGMSTVAEGTARQKHYYNQTTATILDSFNVSSITDVSTGSYDPQATNSMSSVNYNVVAHAQAQDTNATFTYYGLNRATGSYRRYNYDNASKDLNATDGILFGDLA